jgi:hypothetical protein
MGEQPDLSCDTPLKPGDEDDFKKPHPRVARVRLAAAKDYHAHLCFARRARLQLGEDVSDLDDLLTKARGLIDRFSALAEGHIEGRRRPPKQRQWTDKSAPRRQFFLCIDECGSHHINPMGDRFPAFALSGVFIDYDKYRAVDRTWKTWKSSWLGSPGIVVHEPEVRRRTAHFYRPDPNDEQALLESLEGQLGQLEYGLISAVINKNELHAAYGDEAVDDFLPVSQYLMALDFVIERFVHFLYYSADDARGIVLAESRGTLEDALVQHEYVRLMIEGTQYHSASWFRYQLAPFVEFLPKARNHTGLQLADLSARPCAEKVLAPNSRPERWDVFRSKLYDGGIGRPESYGLKAFPTSAAALIFAIKAEEDAEAPSSAD